jgi:hypothetical protein
VINQNLRCHRLKDDHEMETVMTVVDNRVLGLLLNWIRKACLTVRQMSELFLSQQQINNKGNINLFPEQPSLLLIHVGAINGIFILKKPLISESFYRDYPANDNRKANGNCKMSRLSSVTISVHH